MANKSSGGAASAPPRRLNWNDPDVRSVVYQVVALGLVVLVGWFLVSNTLHNMEVRNIASGFGFLSREAGAIRWASVAARMRSEEHTSELQSLMRISYAVFCLKKKKNHDTIQVQK